MNNLSELLPCLWKLIEKKKCAINVSTKDNEVVVNIINRFKTHCFRDVDSDILISKLEAYLQQ